MHGCKRKHVESECSRCGPGNAGLAENTARREGISVNALVLRLLDQGLGKVQRKSFEHRYGDLDSLAGAWSEEEAAEFESATAPFSDVEPELWR